MESEVLRGGAGVRSVTGESARFEREKRERERVEEIMEPLSSRPERIYMMEMIPWGKKNAVKDLQSLVILWICVCVTVDL